MQTPSPWRVLVVDDEADIRDVIGMTLSDAGYEVAAAVDGQDGLDRAEIFDPHLVVTDLRMPRRDGLSVLRELKTHRPRTEVIVVTAYGELNLAIEALRLDASDFITKPIDNQALDLALKRAEQRYSSRRRIEEYTRLLEAENAQTTQELIRVITYQRKLIQSSMDGIVGCDAHERIVTFNRAAADMLDVRRESALGRPLADYFPPDRIGRWREALDGPSHGGPGRLNLFESEMTGPGGVKVPVQLSAVRIEEEAGAGGLVFFVRDLRAIRRLEREMADQAHVLHQDKMMSLGRLAASVVHEINNPLSGVLNYVRLMRRTIDRGPLDDRQIQRFRGNLETVEAETARVSEIAANLLAFSRRPAAHMTDLDLPALVQRAASLCRHRLELDHIELEVDFDQNTPPVRGDANQIQQCLINLIFNARDAMPQGGRVTVSVRNDGPGQVAVQVADTGPGVPSELRPHLFEPFFTTKDEGYGVGLGLSTVYGIAAHHGGRIDVNDAPSGGAVFTLRLPARSDQET